MSELIIPIKQYARTAAQLATENPILVDRQLVIESDTGKMKLGNGTTAYNSLPYLLVSGNTSQYVRGDGSLATLPTNGGGGGASVSYYLNGSVTQGTFGGTTYYEMSKTPIFGAGTNFTRTNAQGNGYIASFITDAGDPSLLNIPSGNWNVEFYFQANTNAGNPQFYAELYKVDASNNFTLVGSGSTNPEGITNGTTIDQYYTAIPVPQTSLLVTDRLAIRIYVIPAGRTITLHTENSNLCEVITTFSTGLNALNGLTAQVQYFATGTSGTDFAISSATDTHTFNLPTASATNRGALASADWTTFNNKQNALTNPVTGTGTTNYIPKLTASGTIGNSQIFDNGSAVLINTTTSDGANKLQVNGTIRSTTTNGWTLGNASGYQRIDYGAVTAFTFGFWRADNTAAHITTANIGATGNITATGSITAGADLYVINKAGIGSIPSSPQGILHVEGDNGSLTGLFVGTGALGTTSGASNTFAVKAVPNGSAQRLGALAFGSRGGADAFYNTAAISAFSESAWTLNSSHPTYLIFQTTPVGATSRVEVGRIASTGNWTIGSTTSTSMFNVGTSGQFQVNSSGAIAAVVGITSSADITISRNGASFFRATSLNSNVNAGLVISTGNAGTLQSWTISGNASGANGEFSIRDATAGINAFTILKSSGNVGIGTTNPLSLLSVGATSQFQVNSSGATVATSFAITGGSATQVLRGNGTTTTGVSGSFTTVDGKTITVTSGVITAIV